MNVQQLEIGGKKATGYVISLGNVNIVMLKTEKGMLACRAVDVAVLDKFAYPAARVRFPDGRPIAAVADILRAEVCEVNEHAGKLGVAVGIKGGEALQRL